MTNYTINGGVAKEIVVTLKNGDAVRVLLDDEVTKSDLILLPKDGKPGEFLTGMMLVGEREEGWMALSPREDSELDYAEGGKSDKQPLLRVSPDFEE